MKYNDSIQRSAELLRQALPMMSRQSAALNPISYAVWYTYLREAESPLRQAVDAHLQQHGTLDEAATESLYRRFIDDADPAAAQHMVDGAQRLLAGMFDSATLASNETARYGQTLSRVSQALDGEALASLDEVREHTTLMQATVQRLQQRLEESQREIGSLREEVRRTRTESLQDSLTGLANRRAFDQRLAACLAAMAADPDAPPPILVVADIDHFKRINDNYGHAFGDQILKAVAQVLRTVAPDSGLSARIGGEEFALLLPATPLEASVGLAERVRTAIAGSRIRRKGHEDPIERVTVSLGVTAYRAGESAVQFVDRADQALYASKSGGRDRVTTLGA
ncbi:GGDEF domain-containing protein [Ideonella sp. A 288]|uniref:GGDEF domain-containing protein n=1 Tax=Ideonella sp. A 288 TaxID=1962181 RepID=UPI001184E281|nr:GGDEF domain-containing protein [Ideonella sp. A 288]